MKDDSNPHSQNSISPLIQSRPAGALRVAFRLPTYLYRLNLGRLLGHRFLLLTHQGRKSGIPRQTILEVILYDQATRESIVLSGRGEKADWYRNIEARPALEVRTGGDRYVPEQRFLAPEENYGAISEYARHHPLPFQFLIKAFGFGYPLDGTEEAQRRFAGSLRLVAFQPASCANFEATRAGVTSSSTASIAVKEQR